MKNLLLISVFSLFAAFHAAAAPALSVTSITNGAVVPKNWLHPIIEWEDSAPADASYTITVAAGDTSVTREAIGRRLVLDGPEFAALLDEPSVRFTVSRSDGRGGRVESSVEVSVDASAMTDSVIYRMVEPLFNPGQDAVIEILRLQDADPGRMPAVAETCVGCHAYAEGSLAINARRGQDRRLISSAAGGGANTGAPVFNDRKIGEFSFVNLSPDGKLIALTMNTKSLIQTKKTFIEAFDMVYVSGDIALCGVDSGEPKLLPGASDPDLVEDMPAWSPDGKTLVFCGYAPTPSVVRLKPISIYTMEVNGGKGGTAKPLLKKPPSQYCYFPRYSPDGKWISFVSGDASKSYFARQSSDIWLYRLADGRLKKLECSREGAMDSWHAWSSDSRWLVFSSKRDATDLTALYLSRIEADGTARPPVKITWNDEWKVNLPFLVRTGRDAGADAALGAFLKEAFSK